MDTVAAATTTSTAASAVGVGLRLAAFTIAARALFPVIKSYLPAKGSPPRFSEEEVGSTLTSLKNAAGSDNPVDWDAVAELIATRAHLGHKDWKETEASAAQLAKIIGGPDSAAFREMFERVLVGGNWNDAQKVAEARSQDEKPWVVLVTGVNGIRKTTSVYQPWFREVLSEALGASFKGSKEELPVGNSSFFRQLDYMIATVANESFKNLYRHKEVGPYATEKSKIFSRYRTLAEMLGVLLVKEARKRRMNVMVETSGKDIASFQYVNYFFPEHEYRKLVLHFTVNDIKYAEKSVDLRMLKEMKKGATALAEAGNARRIISVNAGGPYGSAVLKGVQQASEKVWERVEKGDAGEGWYKANIAVTADSDRPWTACAIPKKGLSGQAYTFTSLQEKDS